MRRRASHEVLQAVLRSRGGRCNSRWQCWAERAHSGSFLTSRASECKRCSAERNARWEATADAMHEGCQLHAGLAEVVLARRGYAVAMQGSAAREEGLKGCPPPPLACISSSGAGRAAQGLIAGPITKPTIILTFGDAFDGAAVHIAGPCFAVGVGYPTHFGAHERRGWACGGGAVGNPTLVGRAVLCGAMAQGHSMARKAGRAGPSRGLACAPTLLCPFLCPSRAVRAVLCLVRPLRGRAHPTRPRRHQPSAGAPIGQCGGAVFDRGGAGWDLCGAWASALQSGAAWPRVAAGYLPAVVWAARVGVAALAAWLADRWCGAVLCQRAAQRQLRARDRTTSSLPRPAPTLAVRCVALRGF